MKYDRSVSDRCPRRSFYIVWNVWMSGALVMYTTYVLPIIYHTSGMIRLFLIKIYWEYIFPLKIDCWRKKIIIFIFESLSLILIQGTLTRLTKLKIKVTYTSTFLFYIKLVNNLKINQHHTVRPSSFRDVIYLQKRSLVSPYSTIVFVVKIVHITAVYKMILTYNVHATYI